jgi:uncharacterized protein YoxC
MTTRGYAVEPFQPSDLHGFLFDKSETVVRASTTAFLYTGLIATLYNLWLLGPAFWQKLLSPSDTKVVDPTMDLAFAFSGSLFGIGLALVTGSADSLVLGHFRTTFTNAAAHALNRRLAQDTQRRADLVVADTLATFTERSHEILTDLRNSTELLLTRTSDVLLGSAGQFSSSLVAFRDDWREFWATALAEVQLSVRDLRESSIEATQSSKSLATSLTTINRDIGRLEKALSGLTDQTAALVIEMKRELQSFNETNKRELKEFIDRWSSTLKTISEDHAQVLGRQGRDLQAQFTDLLDAWHTRHAAAIQSFADSIRTSASGLTDRWQASWTATESALKAVEQHARGSADVLAKSLNGFTAVLAELQSAAKRLADLPRAMAPTPTAGPRSDRTSPLPSASPSPSPVGLSATSSARASGQVSQTTVLRELGRQTGGLETAEVRAITNILRETTRANPGHGFWSKVRRWWGWP